MNDSDVAAETPEETEHRKAEELARLIAKGFLRDELTWTGGWREPTREEWESMSAGLPKGRATDEQREASRRTAERMRRGTWVIKHVGVERVRAERAKAEAAK